MQERRDLFEWKTFRALIWSDERNGVRENDERSVFLGRHLNFDSSDQYLQKIHKKLQFDQSQIPGTIMSASRVEMADDTGRRATQMAQDCKRKSRLAFVDLPEHLMLKCLYPFLEAEELNALARADNNQEFFLLSSFSYLSEKFALVARDLSTKTKALDDVQKKYDHLKTLRHSLVHEGGHWCFHFVDPTVDRARSLASFRVGELETAELRYYLSTFKFPRTGFDANDEFRVKFREFNDFLDEAPFDTLLFEWDAAVGRPRMVWNPNGAAIEIEFYDEPIGVVWPGCDGFLVGEEPQHLPGDRFEFSVEFAHDMESDCHVEMRIICHLNTGGAWLAHSMELVLQADVIERLYRKRERRIQDVMQDASV